MVVVDTFGYLMVLDLLAYLLRLNAQKIDPSYKLYKDERFAELTDPAFKLHFFLCPKTTEELPYAALVKTLTAWKDAYHFTNFEFYERQGNEDDVYFYDSYFKELLPPQVTRVVLSGSKPLVLNAKYSLTLCGYPEDVFIEL